LSQDFDGARVVRNGKADGRLDLGKGTTTIMAIHLSPKQWTTFFRRANCITATTLGFNFVALSLT
jgi:hypothetical protein